MSTHTCRQRITRIPFYLPLIEYKEREAKRNEYPKWTRVNRQIFLIHAYLQFCFVMYYIRFLLLLLYIPFGHAILLKKSL